MTYLKSLKASNTLPFSIAQVIPGTVIGPSELIKTATDASAHMDRMSRTLLFNDSKPRYAFGFVHVEDCARVHIEALDEERVPDKELPDWFIAAAGSEKSRNGKDVWKEAARAIENCFRDEVLSGTFNVVGENAPINMPFYVDSSVTESMLLSGEKFKGIVECVEEVGHWYVQLAQGNP
jgi:nucleoside-diphosphate-sugar epimerase